MQRNRPPAMFAWVVAAILFGLATSAPAHADVWRTEPELDLGSLHDAVYVADNSRHRMLALLPDGDPYSTYDREHTVFGLAFADTTAWIPISTTGTPPPNHVPFVAVHDPSRDRLVLIGDFDPDVPGLEAFALDLAGTPHWSVITPVGAAPPVRTSPSATYDPLSDRVLLFGGTLANGAVTNETWELDFTPNVQWVDMNPAGLVPPALAAAPVTFDAPHRRLVVIEPAAGDASAPFRPARGWTLDVSGAPAWDFQVPGGPQPTSTSLSSEAGRDSSRNMLDIADPEFLNCGVCEQPSQDFWGLRLDPQMSWVPFGPVPGKPQEAVTAHLVFEEARTRPWMVSESHVYRMELTDPVAAWRRIPVAGTLRSDQFDGISGGAFDPTTHRFYTTTSGGTGFTFLLARASGRWGWADNPGFNPVQSFPGSGQAQAVDFVNRRVVSIGGESGVQPSGKTNVLELCPDSSTGWHPLKIVSPPARSYAAATYDSARHLVYLYGGFGTDASFTALADFSALDLSGTPHWTTLAAAPVAAAGASLVYDSVHDQVILWGGAGGTANNPTFTNTGTYVYHPTAGVWLPLSPAGGYPQPRWQAVSTFDSNRHRVIVSGGLNGPFATGTWQSDTSVLSLDGTPTWSALAADGAIAAPSPYGAYDPGSDELVTSVQGFEQQRTLRILAFDVVPSLTADAPPPVLGAPASRAEVIVRVTNGARQPLRCAYTVTASRAWPGFPRAGVVDVPVVPGVALPFEFDVPDTASVGAQDLLFTFTALDGVSASDTCVAEIDVTDLPQPALACGGDIVWTAGALVPVDYAVSNDSPVGGPITYRLTCDRTWPGFPLAGEFNLPGAGSVPLALAVPVPDTAAVGAVVLHLTVAPKALPASTRECFRHLHDASTPTLLSIVEAVPDADGSGVRLTWWSEVAAQARVTVQRHADGADWATIGSATGDADGRIVYEDRTVVPGTRYAYRAGIVTGEGVQWSSEFWVGVPAAVLAFALRGMPIVRGALDVAFTLPHAGGARLEAFDVRGRLVATRAIDAQAAGRASVRLAEAVTLRPGIYFLRLGQGSASVRGRVLVLGAP